MEKRSIREWMDKGTGFPGLVEFSRNVKLTNPRGLRLREMDAVNELPELLSGQQQFSDTAAIKTET